MKLPMGVMPLLITQERLRGRAPQEREVEMRKDEIRVKTLKEISSLAWEFGATYFTDSPMHRFAMKLQAMVNEAESKTPPPNTRR